MGDRGIFLLDHASMISQSKSKHILYKITPFLIISSLKEQYFCSTASIIVPGLMFIHSGKKEENLFKIVQLMLQTLIYISIFLKRKNGKFLIIIIIIAHFLGV